MCICARWGRAVSGKIFSLKSSTSKRRAVNIQYARSLLLNQEFLLAGGSPVFPAVENIKVVPEPLAWRDIPYGTRPALAFGAQALEVRNKAAISFANLRTIQPGAIFLNPVRQIILPGNGSLTIFQHNIQVERTYYLQAY
ncbi:MAG TPA: hypothetical protein VM123_16520 [archaeon]|nr:hypothetical protein [archaeon]